jgi:hypothetical protein
MIDERVPFSLSHTRDNCSTVVGAVARRVVSAAFHNLVRHFHLQ